MEPIKNPKSVLLTDAEAQRISAEQLRFIRTISLDDLNDSESKRWTDGASFDAVKRCIQFNKYKAVTQMCLKQHYIMKPL